MTEGIKYILRKKRILMLANVFFLMIALCVAGNIHITNQNITLKFECDFQNELNSKSQLYYDKNGEVTEDTSLVGVNEIGGIIFKIPEVVLDKEMLRWDPCNEEQDILLRDILLYNQGVILGSISAEEILPMLEWVDQIEISNYGSEYVKLHCLGEDPKIFFNNKLIDRVGVMLDKAYSIRIKIFGSILGIIFFCEILICIGLLLINQKQRNSFILFIKENKPFLIIYMVIIIFVLIVPIPASNLKMVTKYGDKVTGIAKIYFDMGKGFSEADGIKVTVEGKEESEFNIRSAYINAKAIRWDIIEEKSDVYLETVVLYNYGKKVGEIQGRDIINYVSMTDQIDDFFDTEDGGTIIKVSGEDPKIFMNDFFLQYIIKCSRNDLNAKRNFILLISFFLILYIIFVLLIDSNKRYYDASGCKQKSLSENKCMLFLLFSLMIICFILFYRYIRGYGYFIFHDIASDSYTQTYPILKAYAGEWLEKGKISLWNFQAGIGNDYSGYLNIFNLFAIVLGAKNIEYSFAIMAILKILLAGLFFYFYLRELGMSKLTAVLFSISYAFCGHMIIRAPWNSYSAEVVLCALWLYGIEKYIKCGKTIVMYIALALLYSVNYYFVVLYSALTIAYYMFRYMESNDNLIFKEIMKTLGKICGILILILAISSPLYITNIVKSLGSPRLSSSISHGINFKEVATIWELCTVFFSTISMDIMGISSDWVGKGNCLYSGTLYCGLFGFILVPQIFCNSSRKNKIMYSVIFGGIACYILFPWLRTILNGFAESYYKLSSFWIIVWFFYCASRVFERWYREERLNAELLTIVTAIIIVLAIAMIVYAEYSIVYSVYIDRIFVSLALMVFYMGIISWLSKKKRRGRFWKYFLVLLICFESVLFSWRYINERDIFDINEMQNHEGYYDGTIEAVKYIQSIEQEKFYRIAKDYSSVYLCDSLVQGFNGIAEYAGGTFSSPGYVRFVDSLNGAFDGGSIKFILGFQDITQVNSLLNVKYILSKEETINYFGYEMIKKIGDIYIFQNRYFVPFGVSFSSYMANDTFETLEFQQRREVILQTCVLDENVYVEELDVYEFNNKKEYETYRSAVYDIEGNRIIVKDSKKEQEMMLLEMTVQEDLLDGETAWLYWKNEEGDVCYKIITLHQGVNKYDFEFNNIVAKEIWIQFSGGKVCELNVAYIEKEEYYEEYILEIEKLKKGSMTVEEFSNQYIKAEFVCDENAMLLFTIPYDKGWRISIDGKRASLLQLDNGLSGVAVGSGKHDIQLQYFPYGLEYACMISIIALIIIFCFKILKRNREVY